MARFIFAGEDDEGQSKIGPRLNLDDLNINKTIEGFDEELRKKHEESPDSMDLVKLVLLGAPCVGKSSIIQQFVWNDFSEDYASTETKQTYYPSAIINDHLYELKIIDLPVIPYFPVNSLYEWNDFRFYGLRSATAYILVFDLTSMETFQYIRAIREQMFESRNMHNVPLIVVGNKQDLCQGHVNGVPVTGSGQGSSRASEESRKNEARREVINIVKKQWKCSYVECSAKYNWHIVTLFKEVMKNIDYIDYGPKHANNSVNMPGLNKSKCVIL